MVGSSLIEKVKSVQFAVNEACQRAGRSREEVLVLAVTKLKTSQDIRLAYSVGLTHFGENYVQEALTKQEELRDLPLSWHFIGHLQSKKAKQVIGRFELIHSVDRLSLVRELSARASHLDEVQEILIQVNIAGEQSKSGVMPKDAKPLIGEVQRHSHLRLRGLMTMPPLAANEREARAYFAKMRQLREECGKEISPGTVGHAFDHLSMGTSHDFVWAIEEGATIVRLGTVLLGERPAKN